MKLFISCVVGVLLLVAGVGCVVKAGGHHYEAETVTVTLGTGNFLPGGNVFTTYRRQAKEEVIAEDPATCDS
jgi:hypothetical protein